MKVEGLLFALLSVFLLVSAGLYWGLSYDPTGSVCLTLAGLMCGIIAFSLLLTARRIELRPEDRPDAEIAEGAGEVGFFSPHSWWPVLLAGAFTTTTLGLIFGPFIIIIGFFCLVIAVSGFVLEYYLGINRTQAETLSTVMAGGNLPTSDTKFLGEQSH
ncbi:MAG: hypothetical protein JWN31_94 [Frankiales bacterium]|nr:hypothetical protein [Frankiales bacterium]